MEAPRPDPITPTLSAAAEAYGLRPDDFARYVARLPGHVAGGCWRLRPRPGRGLAHLPRLEAVEVTRTTANSGTASVMIGRVRINGILWSRTGGALVMERPQVCGITGEWRPAYDLPPEVWAAVHLIVDTLAQAAPFHPHTRRHALPGRRARGPAAQEAPAA